MISKALDTQQRSATEIKEKEQCNLALVLESQKRSKWNNKYTNNSKEERFKASGCTSK